jgi:hypothetical protein
VFSVSEDGIDLPRLPFRAVHPHLVLHGEAAGGVLPDRGGQTRPGQAGLGGGHLLGRVDLDAEMVQRAGRLGGVLDQDQLERRLGDGEVGVAGPDFGRFGGEQLGVEGDCFVKVGDVEGELDTGDRRGKWVWYSLNRDRLANLRAAIDA